MSAPHEIDREKHEKLCAYVFGELQGAERAAFEAELARDPALAAERDVLARTAQLVKSALPEEKLPESIRATLRRAAERGPVRRRFVLLRGGGLYAGLAAAAAVVVGVFLWRSVASRDAGPFATGALGDKLARAPENERKELESGALDRERAVGKDVTERLRGLGYIGEGPTSPAPRADAPKAEEAPELDAEMVERMQALGYTTAAPETSVSSTSLQGAPSIGRVGGATSDRFAANQASPSAPAASKPTGQYRGPGDSVLPGGGGGETSGVATRRATGAMKGRMGPTPTEQALRALGYSAPSEGPQDNAIAANPQSEELGRAQQSEDGRRPVLPPEEVKKIQEQTLDDCRIRLGETPAMMFFRCWGDHPFVPSAEDRLSTFAIDVDTASYTLARGYLNAGLLPTKTQVRTEEFVNYFRADAPPPADGATFSIGLEEAPSLFGGSPEVELLRVTVRGKDVASFERKPLALTFVVDNSGSMGQGGRLALVKDSLRKLLGQLAPSDSIALVIFHQEAQQLAAMTSAANRGRVEDLLAGISIAGGTNVEAGLALGFETASAGLTPNAVNRVVLFSDGVGNIGETQAQALLAEVAAARARGIYLNTFGVGLGNHNDTFLEQLADKGDGLCQYIDSPEEAERALVQRFSESLEPIARDAKIQVEFDPARVASWRLLGYENRAIADEKFRDDRIDAGEVNAGHQVTALYELVRTAAADGPIAIARVRFKPPFSVDAGTENARAKAEAEVAQEIERTIGARDVAPSFGAASAGYRRSVLVAQFAELLRRSVHASGDSRELLVSEARKLARELSEPEVTEFAGLVEKALPLLARAEDQESALQPLVDELARLNYEKGQRERLEKPLAPEEEEAVERRIAELEQQIRRKIGEQSGLTGQELDTLETLEQLRKLGYTGDHR